MYTIEYSVVDDIPEEIFDILDTLGVPQHLKGYDYLAYAINLIAYNKSKYKYVTKELYPTIADAFNTTSNRVERAIRHSISRCLDTCDPETLVIYLGNTIKKGNIPNSQFIFTLGNLIHRELIKKG